VYCRNADWFSVSNITQDFQCRRCGRTQTHTPRHWKQPEKPAWSYELDELIYLGYRHGMAVPLLAVDYLRKRSESNFTFTTDREFWLQRQSKPEAARERCALLKEKSNSQKVFSMEAR